MKELQMVFFSDIKQIAINELNNYGISSVPKDDLDKILQWFFNLKTKLVKPRNRKVFVSTELTAHKLAPEYERALQLIIKKMQNGEDVNCHLSKKALNPQKHDLLLYDWFVYHFHLSTSKRKSADYLFKRSDWLAFALVFENDVYFLEVCKHKEKNVFAKKAFLEIIKRNWPSLLAPYQLKGFSIKGGFTDEDTNNLRRTGINVIHKVGDKIYIPMGGGITGAKTSTNIQMNIIKIKKWVNELNDYISENYDQLLEKLKTEKKPSLSALDFKIQFINEKFEAIEINSNFVVSTLDYI